MNDKKNEPHCSFCNTSNEDLEKNSYRLIQAPYKKSYICENCSAKITIASDLFNDDFKSKIKKSFNLLKNFTPKDCYNFLDSYIMFQDSAKKTLSLAAYHHVNRISNSYKDENTNVSKSNIMLIGPSGTGKTLLVETLSDYIDVPYICVNASSFTANGYVGKNVDDIIDDLYSSSNFDIDKTEKGIIFIDEFDKIAQFGKNEDFVNSVSVQQSLLKLIEGTIVYLEKSDVYINTKNILFIFAGAFDSIKDIVSKRIIQKNRIGFEASLKNELDIFNYSEVKHEDIKKYGFIDEILGRIPIIVPLENIDKYKFVKMLREPKNSLLKQIDVLFNKENCSIEYDEPALIQVAEKSLKLGLGARGAKTILLPIIEDFLFTISGTGESFNVILKLDSNNELVLYKNDNKLKQVI